MKISFSKRTERGKQNKKLRLDGFVPVVCYGAGKETSHYSISLKEFNKFLKGDDVVISGSGELSGQSILIQAIDRNPVTEVVRHIDFRYVDSSHKVEHNVPVELEGDAPALKRGGFVGQQLFEITVEALPQNIPTKILVDLTGLEEIGQHIKISDLPAIEDVTIMTSPDEIIVTVTEQVEEVEETQKHQKKLISQK